jgi:hypothetical protein
VSLDVDFRACHVGKKILMVFGVSVPACSCVNYDTILKSKTCHGATRTWGHNLRV